VRILSLAEGRGAGDGATVIIGAGVAWTAVEGAATFCACAALAPAARRNTSVPTRHTALMSIADRMSAFYHPGNVRKRSTLAESPIIMS
jgi:hypothetical protein